MKRILILSLLLVAALAGGAWLWIREAHIEQQRRFDRAVALTGANQIDEADEIARSIKDVDRKKLTALGSAIARRRAASYPLVFDRDGNAIANFQPATNDLIAIDSRYTPLIERESGALTIESNLHRLGTANTIETTLDPFVQNAAIRALGGYHGAIVAIDPRTNEILAIASNGATNLALEKQYEPGSIIKVLTGLNAISHNLNSEFPKIRAALTNQFAFEEIGESVKRIGERLGLSVTSRSGGTAPRYP